VQFEPNSLNLNFIKISAQIINKISKFQQNEKQFNLCQNGKGTMVSKENLAKF
jgi:hypothetical protein